MKAGRHKLTGSIHSHHPCVKGSFSLRQSDEKYRLIFNDAQVGLFRSRITDGKILESNYRMAAMFGFEDLHEFTRSCVVSERYLDPGARQRLLAMLRERGEVQGYEAEFRRKDGTTFWLRYSGRIYPEKGYIDGVAVDITEQKLTESALRYAKANLEHRVDERTRALLLMNKRLKAEMYEHKKTAALAMERQQQLIQADKMASLGALLSGMAHEINNPVGLILVNIPVLKDACSDALEILDHVYDREGDFSFAGLPYSRMSERLPRVLNTLEQSAKRVGRIIDDLRNFSQKSDPLQSDEIDLNRVLGSAIRLTRESLKKATDHFSLRCAENLPPVRGNRQRIEQVLVNLLLNATQALRSPAESIEVSTWADSGKVHVKIEDQGVGIPNEDIPHITEPFFTTHREAGGTGLGLWISASIVEQHGGELQINSQPGEGTGVVLCLRAAEGDVS